MDFCLDFKDVENGVVVITGEKTLYSVAEEDKARVWARGGIPSRVTTGTKYPQLTNATSVHSPGTGVGKCSDNAIGYFHNNSNSIQQNNQNVGIYSSPFKSGNGFEIQPVNFMSVVCSFSSRRLISGQFVSWLNAKDEYRKPNIDDSRFPEFSYDSLVFSLFESKSNQSSLRKVEYKEGVHDIKNEFFFMSKQKMQSLADAYSNQKCFNDARHAEDRFVSKLIKAIESGDNDAKFSDEAQLVLNLARELVIDSFEHRPAFDKVKPEYQINNWDCGWYQIKGLLNWVVDNKKDSEVADKYSEFKDAYKALGDKMRPMVYELGFLKK